MKWMGEPIQDMNEAESMKMRGELDMRSFPIDREVKLHVCHCCGKIVLSCGICCLS